MHLIIGLGNPDPQYEETRHNIGFVFLDALAKYLKSSPFETIKKIEAQVSLGKWNGQKTTLLKPLTFVNQSGLAAKKAKLFFKIKNDRIIVVHDDLDVPFGKTKLAPQSGAGGHRGVNSILKQLKTERLWRLKIGTANRKLFLARHQGSDQKRKEMITAFVLSKFTPAEKKELKKIFKEGTEKLESLVS